MSPLFFSERETLVHLKQKFERQLARRCSSFFSFWRCHHFHESKRHDGDEWTLNFVPLDLHRCSCSRTAASDHHASDHGGRKCFNLGWLRRRSWNLSAAQQANGNCSGSRQWYRVLFGFGQLSHPSVSDQHHKRYHSRWVIDRNTVTDGIRTHASFSQPRGMCVYGNSLYIVDSNCIRRMDLTTYAVTTFAGQPSASGTADGIGTNAQFSSPQGLACYATTDSILLIADKQNYRIRSVKLSNAFVSTIAGSSTSGSTDGVGTIATFNGPSAIAIDPSTGLAYIADYISSSSGRIRRLNITSRSVDTLAGSALGYVDGNGTSARFRNPTGIFFDTRHSGLVVVDQGNHVIRWVSTTGRVTTLAGAFPAAGSSFGSADGDATTARFNSPADVTMDSARGRGYFVADRDNNALRYLSIQAPTPSVSISNATSTTKTRTVGHTQSVSTTWTESASNTMLESPSTTRSSSTTGTESQAASASTSETRESTTTSPTITKSLSSSETRSLTPSNSDGSVSVSPTSRTPTNPPSVTVISDITASLDVVSTQTHTTMSHSSSRSLSSSILSLTMSRSPSLSASTASSSGTPSNASSVSLSVSTSPPTGSSTSSKDSSVSHAHHLSATRTLIRTPTLALPVPPPPPVDLAAAPAAQAQASSTTTVAAAAILGGDPVSASQTAFLSIVTCGSASGGGNDTTGEGAAVASPPPSTVTMLTISVFYAHGPVAMGFGNLGLITLVMLLHALITKLLANRNGMSFIAAAEHRWIRFPHVSLRVASFLIPGIVYGAFLLLMDTTRGAAAYVLGPLLLVAAAGLLIARHLVLTRVAMHRAQYRPYSRNSAVFQFLSRAEKHLFPNGRWCPHEVRNAFGVILSSYSPRAVKLATLKVSVGLCLAAVTAIAKSRTVALCAAVMQGMAAVHYAVAVWCAALRPFRLKSDVACAALTYALYGTVCLLLSLHTPGALAAAADLQALCAAVSMVRITLMFLVLRREGQMEDMESDQPHTTTLKDLDDSGSSSAVVEPHAHEHDPMNAFEMAILAPPEKLNVCQEEEQLQQQQSLSSLEVAPTTVPISHEIRVKEVEDEPAPQVRPRATSSARRPSILLLNTGIGEEDEVAQMLEGTSDADTKNSALFSFRKKNKRLLEEMEGYFADGTAIPDDVPPPPPPETFSSDEDDEL